MRKEENIKFREEIIKEQFRNALGYELNLENPKTFNEKLQWLKLYYHDPLITKCADKYLVREYIKETIGEEYLIPLIGVWDKVEDIDFDKLPNQFVLKVNWGSGQNIIVKDKSKLDIEEAKNKLRYWMQPTSNHYYYSYEWAYKNIKPRIICEKYINESEISEAFVYRMFFFNRILYYINLDIPFYNKINNNVYFKSLHYNSKWEKFNLKTRDEIFESNIIKPQNLEYIINIAEQISRPFVFVRTDLYNIKGSILFGELTFYPNNGIGKFDPIKWDYKFGELLKLPKEKRQEYDILDKESIIKEACNLEPIVKQYRDLEYNHHCANVAINNLNNDINIKNDTINYINNKLNYINSRNEELKLNLNWFSILSIFGIQLFAISNNSNYLRLTILGIKLTFKVNEESINKISWWIPIRSLRNNFRSKFKIADQTRPDQTKFIILYVFIFFIIIQKIKNYNLCCNTQMQHRFFYCNLLRN